MRWLVVRGGALGDFLLAAPALARVRASARRVTLAATPRYAALLPELADRVLDVRGLEALWLFGAGAPPEPYDAALVMTPGVAEHLRAIPDVREVSTRPPPGVHVAAHILAAVADLPAVPPPALRPRGPVEAVAARLPGPWPVVLAPGASAEARRWPGLASVGAGLAARGVPVVWAPGRDEPVPAGLSGAVLADLDLDDLVALASVCGAWIGNDTGPSHLAAMAGAPTICLFGPTDPASWCPPGAVALPFEATPKDVVERALSMKRTGPGRGDVHTHRPAN